MANHKHVEILAKGVDVWNAWRQQDLDIKPNLSGTNLFQAQLSDVNLNQTDLRKTDFRQADLRQAEMVKADLRNANLRAASAVGAKLISANMSGAHLIKTDLSKADLLGADMRGIRLDGADLYEARLEKANLSNANLPRTNLLGADLARANMRGCNLTDAVMVHTNLNEADLSLADVTGVRFYGSQREEWKVDGINCKYAYWERSGDRRTPVNREYNPGEFELLYRQSPTIEYRFKDGFTPLKAVMMDHVVKVINAERPSFELNLDSLILRGIPRAVFSVLHREDGPHALELITKHYDHQKNLAAVQDVQTCIDNIAAMDAHS